MTDEKHAPDIEDEWLKEERLAAAAIMESGVYGIELDVAKSATKATLKIARALVEWRKELRAIVGHKARIISVRDAVNMAQGLTAATFAAREGNGSMKMPRVHTVRRMRQQVNLDDVVFSCPCGDSIRGQGEGLEPWIKSHIPHTSDRGRSIEETLTTDGARAGGKTGTVVRKWRKGP